MPERWNRRKFVKVCAASVAGAAVVLPDIVLSTPQSFKKKESQPFYDIFPGWIETAIEAPLISSKKDVGHLFWLRQASDNKHIKQLTTKIFSYFFEKIDKNERAELGDIYRTAMDNALDLFGGLAGGKIKPRTNIYLEALHAASIAVAIPMMNWLKKPDLDKFGLSTKQKEIYRRYWFSDGFGTRVMPLLFGKEDIYKDRYNTGRGYKPRSTGQDRSIHFASHFFITFEYLYSYYHGLKEHESIPRGVDWYVKALGLFKNKPSDLARAFSIKVGDLYKIKELGDSLDYWKFYEDPPAGPWNNMVNATHAANRFGTECAIKTFEQAYSGKRIDNLLDQFDNPRYSRLGAVPLLFSE